MAKIKLLRCPQNIKESFRFASCLLTGLFLNTHTAAFTQELEKTNIPAISAPQVYSPAAAFKVNDSNVFEQQRNNTTGNTTPAFNQSTMQPMGTPGYAAGARNEANRAYTNEPTGSLDNNSSLSPSIKLKVALGVNTDSFTVSVPGNVISIVKSASDTPNNNTTTDLDTSHSNGTINIFDGAKIIDERTGNIVAELRPQNSWQVSLLNNVMTNQRYLAWSNNNSSFTLNIEDPYASGTNSLINFDNNAQQNGISRDKLTVRKGFIIVPQGQSQTFSFNGRTYRGALLIRPSSMNVQNYANKLIAINLVDLEDYLLSVVPSEMPSSWNIEALKAQAIAARSYAVSNLGKYSKDGYDLKSTTEDQVYSGMASENPSSTQAVTETRNIVITCQNKVITAFFHSSSGGKTEIIENTWTRDQLADSSSINQAVSVKFPFLKSVDDVDYHSPHFNWTKNILVSMMEENLKKQGNDIGALLAIFPLSRSSASRIKSVLLCGSLQSIVVSGEELRNLLSLPSTYFNVSPTEDAYLIDGHGFGHGLGMSQWGARELANQGLKAQEILSYYYKDITVEPLSSTIIDTKDNTVLGFSPSKE